MTPTEILETPITLLSVRPRFAAALIDGSKSVEIRRGRARLAMGSLCLVYASSPVCALVGALRIAEIDIADPDKLWRRWGPKTLLTRAEFDAYLAERSTASAIVVESAVAFAHPVSLTELRSRHTPFVVPQSYRFMAEPEFASVLNGQRRELKALSLAQ